MDYKTALEIIGALVEDCGGELAGEAWRTLLVESGRSASANKQITKPCPFYAQKLLCRLSGAGKYYCGDLPCQLSGKAS